MEFFSNHIIIADAAYIDRMVFNLTVSFERMLGRRILSCDMARWVECVALDGGIRGENNQIDVVLVHAPEMHQFNNFIPAGLQTELNGQACGSTLGEFTFHTLTGAKMADSNEVLIDLAATLSQDQQVKRLIIVPNGENSQAMAQLKHHLMQAHPDQHITLLTMEPVAGGSFRQELLGYSLMQALGITAEEIESKLPRT